MTHNSFANRNILITGGAGFIGSNLAARLVSLGANVVLVDSFIPEYGGNLFNISEIAGQVRLNISDVRDEHSMRNLVESQDYLFNLAGQTSHLDSMKNPYPDLDINVRAQLFILEACRDYNPDIKIVFASTRQVYGKPQYLPVDELHPISPVDVNGINKISGEWYHLLYNNVYGIKASVLRLTNTYGPRMRVKDSRQTFLGIWIRRLIENDPILVYGDGKQVRDFNYVDDVVGAMLLAAESDQANGKVYNLGADDPINLKDTAELLVSLHETGNYQIIPFPDDLKRIDIGDYYGDYGLIHTQLGWKPATPLAVGLEKTLDYYRRFHSNYWETENEK
jgi:UDP-glucose 4-epimerase